MTEDTKESVAAEIAYFERHADDFAAAHKFIFSNASPVDRGRGHCVHKVSLNEHCAECLELYRKKGL